MVKFNPDKLHKDQLGFHIFLLVLSIFMVLPIVFIINNSFKPFTELFAYPPRFFVSQPTFENFRLLLHFSAESGLPLSRYVFNSVLTTTIVILSTLAISSMAAFGLSKLHFKGKETFNKINTLALMFVPVAVAIPRFLIIEKMGVFNTYFAHIIPMLAMPIGIFLLKQFMDQVPDDLIEASKMDGGGNWRVYWSVMLPMVKPALVTVAILTFQASWGNAESSANFMNDESLRTLPFYLNTLVAQSGNIVAGAGLSAVAGLVMFLPNLILFIILQNKVMDSMAHTGIK
ncbi:MULTISPECIES: carbohydrate ABC transporter permease [Paenibacillus]|uniref:carbohydrate ABC transporter permease n=1 Tax=Paenibacillus TaxID=44249 RepID=UPI0004F700D2|nr:MULTISPECIES: carbohydrate ABC transporter permease [Paenibacillus]AIQ34430.1 ABC transporter permease [Paenibacillus sp. FSL R5-0345]OMC92062.1 ABC transporter permease [Paenibacillus odorifer]OMD13006.1 ABC transporter permease [Paenibacillus odorifer]OMD21052.1 ABC transporter permease [Paenibacillus odorifer]OME26387.1 ABC transporter permease [Paenibacillus odorifer]